MRHLLPLVVGLIGCSLQSRDLVQVNVPEAVPGTETSATQVRPVRDFDRVHTETFVDVLAAVGDRHHAELTCDAQLLPHLDTTVEGRTLVVRARASAGDLQPRARCLLKATAPAWVGLGSAGSGNVALTGPAPGLREVTASGSGSVVATGIDSDSVSVSASGSGPVKVSGRARQLAARATGSGNIDARSLAVTSADATTTASANIALTAAGAVHAVCEGSGNIVVSGGAKVDATALGAGRVKTEG
jgi:hypothetical protein